MPSYGEFRGGVTLYHHGEFREAVTSYYHSEFRGTLSDVMPLRRLI